MDLKVNKLRMQVRDEVWHMAEWSLVWRNISLYGRKFEWLH